MGLTRRANQVHAKAAEIAKSTAGLKQRRASAGQPSMHTSTSSSRAIVGGVPLLQRQRLRKVERSSDQVIKPVNLEALTKWVGNIPEDVVRDMAEIAPMLSILDYDPYANPPNYGAPDKVISDNTRKVLTDGQVWENMARKLELEKTSTLATANKTNA